MLEPGCPNLQASFRFSTGQKGASRTSQLLTCADRAQFEQGQVKSRTEQELVRARGRFDCSASRPGCCVLYYHTRLHLPEAGQPPRANLRGQQSTGIRQHSSVLTNIQMLCHMQARTSQPLTGARYSRVSRRAVGKSRGSHAAGHTWSRDSQRRDAAAGPCGHAKQSVPHVLNSRTFVMSHSCSGRAYGSCTKGRCCKQQPAALSSV